MAIPFRTIKELENPKGKTILLRLDINEPTEEGAIKDNFRIRRSIPTILYLKKCGAKIVIIAHLESADKKPLSLKPIARYMNRFVPVGFVPKVTGLVVRSAVSRLKEGGVIMLENLRVVPGEKKNSLLFAKELASLGDIYVNDAFSVSHREHSSITRLPRLLPSYAGFLFTLEYENLSKALRPKKPFLCILGGAKLETKLPLVRRYLPVAKTIFVGGALANPLFKLKGYEVGKSLVDKPIPGLKSLLKNKRIKLPSDAILSSGRICLPNELSREDKIADIGPRTLRELKKYILSSKEILFNGPLGIYDGGFSWGTEELLKLLAKSKAKTIVGGGDTLAMVTELKLEDKFTFVSTAGGAMLEFLAKGTLSGIRALGKNKK